MWNKIVPIINSNDDDNIFFYQLQSIKPALFPSVNLPFCHEEKWVSSQRHSMLPLNRKGNRPQGQLVLQRAGSRIQLKHWRCQNWFNKETWQPREHCRLTKSKKRIFLYFVDCASHYKFLLITILTHFLMYLFISSLYMFRASQCSTSGDRIVLIHHLVRLVL